MSECVSVYKVCVSVFWERVLVQGASVAGVRKPGGVCKGRNRSCRAVGHSKDWILQMGHQCPRPHSQGGELGSIPAVTRQHPLSFHVASTSVAGTWS